MYDVYAPLVSVPETEISFEEAVEMMKECLAPLGEEYISRLTKGVESGWIDVYETPGKTSGAYSFGSYDSYPYILMNYTGKLQDVLTLVHECGHSMHSSYTREAQPFTYGDYSIFVAEVASTVNESLTLKHLLDKEKDVEFLRLKDESLCANSINVKAGDFAIFFPHDVHAPMLSCNDGCEKIKKVIVKIKAD